MSKIQKRISFNHFNAIAGIFNGLAHPIRLEILSILEEGEYFMVGDILNKLKIDPTLLSHHLSKMKNLGILESFREGRNVYYRLATTEIIQIFHCIDNCRMKM